MLHAVIYCRVSDPRQGDNLSLSTQEKVCRQYCEREGYDVDTVFVDKESAKTTNRREFLQLLEFCRKNKGRLHAVVVYALNRFSRNTTDHHSVAALLRGYGLSLRSATEPIDETPTGRFMESIVAAAAQLDNDMRAARVTAGMRAAAERGRWVWPAPVGYRNTKGAPSITPDDTAPLVKRAFELYASGMSARVIRKSLAPEGLHTKRGSPLSVQSFDNMLRNPIYTGLIRASSWREAHDGDFTPLITRELFASVQHRLRRKADEGQISAGRHLDHPEFPLRRFVRCGRCSTSMTGSQATGRGGRRYPFYSCRKCAGIYVRKGDMEEAFIRLLDGIQPDGDVLKLWREVALKTWRGSKADVTTRRTRLEQQIAETKRKLARVDDLYIYQQAIDAQTYHAQRDKLRELETLAQLELNELILDDLNVSALLDDAEYVLTHLRLLWMDADVKWRQRIQWTLFPTGLAWTLEGFGTAVTSLQHSLLGQSDRWKSNLVDRSTPTWNQQRESIAKVAALRRSA